MPITAMARVASRQSSQTHSKDSPVLEAGHAAERSHTQPALPDTQTTVNDTHQALSATKTILLLVSVFLSMFLVALDRTIISTAIPEITNEFHSLPDVGWYGSAYLLTCCSFQLLCGKMYTLYSVKAVYLSSVLLFEIGSLICGAAPTSAAFIVGRALAGVGAAGIFAGTVSLPSSLTAMSSNRAAQIVTIVYAVPLHKRPRIQGLFGAVFGISSIVGPLVGGAFTSRVTWRWCFYINLPVGFMAMVVIALCLQIPDQEMTKLSWTEKLSQLDVVGTAVLIPGVACVLLALQWGGQIYPVSRLQSHVCPFRESQYRY